MKQVIVLLALPVLLSGCGEVLITPGYIGPADVPHYRMQPLMQYRGFAVVRPDDPRWHADYKEQSSYEALFRIELPSPTHSFYAMVRNEGIAIDPTNSEEFKKYIDAKNTTHGPRNDLLSYESESTILQGQWCVRYKTKFLDKAPNNSDKPLIMTVNGFDAVHPSWSRTIISAEYSERGNSEEVNGALDKVGEDFLSKVILESEPGKKIGY